MYENVNYLITKYFGVIYSSFTLTTEYCTITGYISSRIYTV